MAPGRLRGLAKDAIETIGIKLEQSALAAATRVPIAR